MPDNTPSADVEATETRVASEPGPQDTHIDVPVGTDRKKRDEQGEPTRDDTDDEETAAEVMPPVQKLLTKMREFFRGRVTPEDLDAAARAMSEDAPSDDPSDDATLLTPHTFSDSLSFLTCAFADTPDWIPFLPKPGTYKHPQYGEIALTPARLARFVQQFNAGVYQTQVPLDAEHETKLSGAAAWIKQLRSNSDGSVDARVDWTDRGRAFLEGDRFKFISPEWYPSWTQPDTGKVFQDVVIGGALTTRPFFKEGSLRALAASEAAQPQRWLPTETVATSEPDKTDPTGDTSMAIDPQAFAEQQAKLVQLSEQLAARETEIKARDAEIKAATERIALIERAGRRQRFSETAKAWTGDTAKHIGLLEKLSDTFGEDSTEVADYRQMQDAVSEQVAAAQRILTAEKGRTGFASAGSAAEKVTVAASEKVKANPKLTAADAQAAVFAENPALYEQYRAETNVRV